MKKIMMLSMTLFIAPIASGPHCIDKQENSLKCPCDCDMTTGRWCINCNHLQSARPITVIDSKKEMTAIRTKTYNSETPQGVLEKLAAQYVKNKYDV